MMMMVMVMMMIWDTSAIWILYGCLVLALLRVHGFEERTPQGQQILLSEASASRIGVLWLKQ